MDRELANLFKNLKNPSYLGAVVGEVIETFPNLRVAIDDKIIIEKEQIFVSQHLMKEYEREFEVEGDLSFDAKTELEKAGVTGQATENPLGHQHDIKINENKFTGKGKIKWTDTIVKGDMVLLIATMDNQNFFLIDKGVSL